MGYSYISNVYPGYTNTTDSIYQKLYGDTYKMNQPEKFTNFSPQAEAQLTSNELVPIVKPMTNWQPPEIFNTPTTYTPPAPQYHFKSQFQPTLQPQPLQAQPRDSKQRQYIEGYENIQNQEIMEIVSFIAFGVLLIMLIERV
jgi:hypothetical protein